MWQPQVVLFYEVVQILARTDADIHWQDPRFLQFIDRCMRRHIAV
jgi:hypothetical protein